MMMMMMMTMIRKTTNNETWSSDYDTLMNLLLLFRPKINSKFLCRNPIIIFFQFLAVKHTDTKIKLYHHLYSLTNGDNC